MAASSLVVGDTTSHRTQPRAQAAIGTQPERKHTWGFGPTAAQHRPRGPPQMGQDVGKGETDHMGQEESPLPPQKGLPIRCEPPQPAPKQFDD